MSQTVKVCEGAELTLTNPSVGQWEGRAAWEAFGNWYEQHPQDKCWPTWPEIDAAVSRALGRQVEHDADDVLVNKDGDMVLYFRAAKRMSPSTDGDILHRLRQAKVRVTLAHDAWLKAHGDAVAAKKILLQAKADLDSLVTGLTEPCPLFDAPASPEPHPAIIQPETPPAIPEPATGTPEAPVKAPAKIDRSTKLAALLPSMQEARDAKENQVIVGVWSSLGAAGLHTVGDLLDRADTPEIHAVHQGPDHQRPYTVLYRIRGVGAIYALYIAEQLEKAGLSATTPAATLPVTETPAPAPVTATPVPTDWTQKKLDTFKDRDTPLSKYHQSQLDMITDYRARQQCGRTAPDWHLWSEFTITLRSGEKVEVLYDPQSVGTSTNPSPHFEFHGASISTTSYHSEYWLGRRDMDIVTWATAHAERLAADLAKSKAPKGKRTRKPAKAEAVDA